MANFKDIAFDIVAREIVISNGDLLLTDNPSVQNGGIILLSKCAFVSTPILGVGLTNEIKGSPISNVVLQLNRWTSQCKDDGATNARYTITTNNQPNVNASFETDISYL